MRAFLDGEAAGQAVALQKVTGLRWSVDVDLLPRLRSLHVSSCQRGGTHQIARIFFLLSSLFSNENEKSGLAGAASILSIPDVHSQRASKG
jgi:hypothetical protein